MYYPILVERESLNLWLNNLWDFTLINSSGQSLEADMASSQPSIGINVIILYEMNLLLYRINGNKISTIGCGCGSGI